MLTSTSVFAVFGHWIYYASGLSFTTLVKKIGVPTVKAKVLYKEKLIINMEYNGLK